jgi:hypothetical protein
MDIVDKLEIYEAVWKGSRSFARQKYTEGIPKDTSKPWGKADWSRVFKESEKDFRSNQKELIKTIYPKTVQNAINWVNKNLPNSFGKTPYNKAYSLVSTAHKKMSQSYDERFTGDKKKAMGKEAFWTIINEYAKYIVGSLEMEGWRQSGFVGKEK